MLVCGVPGGETEEGGREIIMDLVVIVGEILETVVILLLSWVVLSLRAKFKTLKSSEQDAARWMLQAMVQLQERLDALESKEGAVEAPRLREARVETIKFPAAIPGGTTADGKDWF